MMRSVLKMCVVIGVLTAGCRSATTTTQASGGSVNSGIPTSTIVLRNRSSVSICHINLSPVSQATWGPDYLGMNVLQPNYDFTLSGVGCNNYDIRLIDQNGHECIVTDINICNEDSGWTIDNNDLDACEGFSS